MPITWIIARRVPARPQLALATYRSFSAVVQRSPPPPERADVLIVGGGPGGLSCKAEMLHQRANGRIVLIDANVEPSGGSRLPKGQNVHPITCELWSRWNPQLIDKISKLSLLPENIQFYINSWNSRESRPNPQDPPQEIDPYLSAFGQGPRVQQKYYEDVLRNHIDEKSQAIFSETNGSCHGSAHYGWAVKSIEKRADGRWLVYAGPASEQILHYAAAGGEVTEADASVACDESIAIVADNIVGCDGGNSYVRKALDVSFREDGEGKGRLGIYLSPIFECSNMYEGLMEQFKGCEPGLFYQFNKGVGFPGAGVRMLEGYEVFYGQIGYKSDDEIPEEIAVAAKVGDKAKLAELATKELERVSDCQFKWKNVKPLEAYLWKPYSVTLPASKWTNKEYSAFLCGDAAHLLSVQGGFGMNAAVCDAINVGWRLSGRLNGWFGSQGSLLEKKVFASYPVDRKANWLRNNGYQKKAVADFVDDKRGGARDTRGYDYAMMGPSAHTPVVGLRATDVILGTSQESKRLHEVLGLCRGYTLALREDSPDAAACAKRFQEIAAKWCVPAQVLSLHDDEEFQKVYGSGNIRSSDTQLYGPTAFVFRPDQVLAWSGRHERFLATDYDEFPFV